MSEEFRISRAADANKGPILAELQRVLPDGARVLEIASGTGQHAAFFASNMPGITWQPSDVTLDGTGLVPRLADADQTNIADPIVLDISHWPSLRPRFDAIFSANCLHIVGPALLAPYITGCAKCLKPSGMILLYGPWRYGGEYTTQSNREFDAFLQETYPGAGMCDVEELKSIADLHGFHLNEDIAMPANNQLLVLRRGEGA